MAITLTLEDVAGSPDYTFAFASGKVLGEKMEYITGSYKDSYDDTKEDKIVSFSTIVKGTAAEIRADYKLLEALLFRISVWQNNKATYESIFLHVASEGETERRTLLKSWSRVDNNNDLSDSLLDKSLTVISDWEFARHYAWEAIETATLDKTNVTISCNSGGAMAGNTATQAADHDGFEWDDTTGLLGDGTRPGRIQRAEISIPQTAGTNQWDRIWIGMKGAENTNPTLADKYRAQTNFTDAYGMTKIDTNVDGARAASDALNAECSEIDFTGSPGIAWAGRLFNNIPHAWRASSPGSYLLLMRMKIEAATSTVARVGMFFGWDNYVTNRGKVDHYEDIYVDNSDWHFYEMGVIQVPPEGYRATHKLFLDMEELNIGISAERVAGTGSLFLDYATWIPMDYFISCSNSHTGGTTGQNLLHIFTTEDDEITAYGIDLVGDDHWPAEVSANNWAWPVDIDKELLIVTAADGYFDDNEAHDFNNSFNTRLIVLPRFFSYNPD